VLANDISKQESTVYASASDFCRIFAQNMKDLYLLSLLLTGDRDKAEDCFASAVDDSMKSNRVFKEWAQSWSRRTVIRNAIRIMKPAPYRIREKATFRTVDTGVETKPESRISLNAVLSLETFERFVFVMSILERYSDQDCAVLLECSRRDLAFARMQAAEHIASFACPSLPGTLRATRTFAPSQLLLASA
jgi:DNA-directed RNA polymerase specialized sigma24 family protein